MFQMFMNKIGIFRIFIGINSSLFDRFYEIKIVYHCKIVV